MGYKYGGQLRVEVFSNKNSDKLQEEVNKFLAKLYDENVSVVDIKMSSTARVVEVLVVYDGWIESKEQSSD